MTHHLCPRPRVMEMGTDVHNLADCRWVTVDPALPAIVRRHAARFASELSSAFASGLQATAGCPTEGTVLVRILRDEGVPAQGYALANHTDGIELRAGDAAGAFYGLQTVRQILREDGPRVREFRIADHPDFAARGVMLDISRCKVPTMETLYGLVDMLASLKVNQFQLYTEHTFAYSGHEAVWADSSPMTAQEILELDAYCAERHVELVPNQNSFGHFERWLKHPGYERFSECADGFTSPWGHKFAHGSTLRPNDDSLALLEEMYAELLPNFSSGLFNAGCDETWDLGKGWSAKLAEERGSSTRVYVDFLLRIHDLVVQHDRTMQFWGDIILKQPELIGELPDRTIALEWGYEFDHKFDERCARFADAGVPFYVCPGTSSWNSLTGRTANALGNLASASRNGLGHGAIGYLNTDWGDGGHHQYLPISYLGYTAGAAFSWCHETNQGIDISDALNRHVFMDATAETGAVLTELGQVCELVSRRFHNRTVLNDLLFREDLEYTLRDVKATELRTSIERLREIVDRIPSTQPCRKDADLLRSELRAAAEMATAGCLRGLNAMGEPIDRPGLYRLLRRALGKHEQLWLARNRPGGLRESAARIEHVLNLVRNA